MLTYTEFVMAELFYNLLVCFLCKTCFGEPEFDTKSKISFNETTHS